jgi:hypothetical protein
MLILGIAIGGFIMLYILNCTPLFAVEYSDNERFEEAKKCHANDSAVAQKVMMQLCQGNQIEGMDSALLSNAINASVHYNHLADSILYQTKIYLLEKDIDDIRQETNNVINKYNGLLSLWIALITVIGGLIPWIVFFRIEDKNESRISSMEERLREDRKKVNKEIDEYKKLRETNTEELKTLKEQLSAEIKDLISKLEKDADTIRKDMANARNQYILETDKNKIINGVFGITSSVNPSINKCNTNREELTKLFLRDLAANLRSFIEHVKQKNDKEPGSDISKEAISVLFQVEFGIIKSQTIFTKIHLHRELSTLHNTIKGALDDLLHRSLLAPSIIKRLDNVLASLYAFERKI